LFQAEKEWRNNGKRGIWFKIRNSISDVIPILIKNNYDFHHANPGYAMLKKWLPENEPDNIPLYPYTFIGNITRPTVLTLKSMAGDAPNYLFRCRGSGL